MTFKLKGPFGLRWSRLREWADVIKAEHRAMTFGTWLKMGAALFAKKPVRGLLLKRYRTCAKCPVFNKSLKSCRPYTGSNLGCGCYAPYAVASGKKCWFRSKGKEFDHLGYF